MPHFPLYNHIWGWNRLYRQNNGYQRTCSAFIFKQSAVWLRFPQQDRKNCFDSPEDREKSSKCLFHPIFPQIQAWLSTWDGPMDWNWLLPWWTLWGLWVLSQHLCELALFQRAWSNWEQGNFENLQVLIAQITPFSLWQGLKTEYFSYTN